MDSPNAKPLYDRLLEYFGGQSAAARALRVRPSVVDNWKSRGIPRGRALDIEFATRGVIPARDVLQAKQDSQ
jgi:DNA-binding transcriptional regulator YdaS (Cro superfamily)